jgi:hypothetical protein
MADSFQPTGPTYLVNSTAPTQVLSADNTNTQQYMIVNITGSLAYLGVGPSSNSVGTVTVPTSTVPSGGTGSVLVFPVGSNPQTMVMTLPTRAYFTANSGATFMVTPGQGHL